MPGLARSLAPCAAATPIQHPFWTLQLGGPPSHGGATSQRLTATDTGFRSPRVFLVNTRLLLTRALVFPPAPPRCARATGASAAPPQQTQPLSSSPARMAGRIFSFCLPTLLDLHGPVALHHCDGSLLHFLRLPCLGLELLLYLDDIVNAAATAAGSLSTARAFLNTLHNFGWLVNEIKCTGTSGALQIFTALGTFVDLALQMYLVTAATVCPHPICCATAGHGPAHGPCARGHPAEGPH